MLMSILRVAFNIFPISFLRSPSWHEQRTNVMERWSIFKLISCLNYYTHNTNKFDVNKTLISYSSPILCLYTFVFCTVLVSCAVAVMSLSDSVPCKLINVAKISQLWKFRNPFFLLYYRVFLDPWSIRKGVIRVDSLIYRKIQKRSF